jgi:hypothetical protein
MHVSNLRRYIEALGGTIEISAHFAETTVRINNIGAPQRHAFTICAPTAPARAQALRVSTTRRALLARPT